MSIRSYPSGFTRQPRDEPQFDSAEHQAMVVRLKRRCAEVDARKVRDSSAVEHRSLESAVAGSNPAPSASSGASVVSGPADPSREPTATAGGESQSGPSVFVQPGLPQLSRPASLKWLQPQGDGVRTDCGRYAVARVTIGGFRRYELRTQLPEGGWKLLSNRSDEFKEAQKLAQRHADGVL